jgi:hypothetical protein
MDNGLRITSAHLLRRSQLKLPFPNNHRILIQNHYKYTKIVDIISIKIDNILKKTVYLVYKNGQAMDQKNHGILKNQYHEKNHKSSPESEPVH